MLQSFKLQLPAGQLQKKNRVSIRSTDQLAKEEEEVRVVIYLGGRGTNQDKALQMFPPAPGPPHCVAALPPPTPSP